jgi:5-methylcytosine-specific restriction endonuclease McrBC regulatory subunit McrC
MSSTEQQVLEEIAVQQEYGDKFISFPEQDESEVLEEEQVRILQKDEDRLDEMGISLTADLEGDIRLKSANTVGAARIGSGREWVGVQVVPKVGNAAFLRMIEYSSIGFASGESEIQADVEDAPTVDLVVNYFAESVREFLRNTTHRSYEYSESRRQGRIKGRIMVDDYVRNSLAKCKPQEVPHRYVDFTADNFENQVIAYSVHLAIQLSKASSTSLSEDTLDTLRECRRELAGVSVKRVTPGELRRFRFTRENDEFERIFRLCELIISNSNVTLGKRQRVPFFSFDLDMANVFERYISAIFTGIYGDRFTSEKSSLTFPISRYGKEIELDGLYEDREKSVVVESKYKVVEEEEEQEDADQPITVLSGSKVRRDDLYQTVAYTSHRDIQADSALLVYPAWEDSSEAVEVYDKVSSFGWDEASDSGTPIYPVTINLSEPPERVVDKLGEKLEEHI